MTPHELVLALIDRSGKPLAQVAREMARSSTFQGTLHKFAHGQVTSPARSTAAKIASYFRLPIEALYDDAAASRVAHDLGLQAPVLTAREPSSLEAGPPPAMPVARFSPPTERRIAQLSHDHLAQLEQIVVAFLDAISPARSGQKRRRAA